MKLASRSLLTSALCVAALAPALFAELPGAHVGSTGGTRAVTPGIDPAALLPPGSGHGDGLWILPTDVNGFVRAKLYDAKGSQPYAIRATIVEYLPANGSTLVQGGWFGDLLAQDPSGAKRKVAEIHGSWIQRRDGTRDFSAAIVARQGNGPELTVGHLAGRTEKGPQILPVSPLGPIVPAIPARLSMNWTISQ